MRLYLNDGDAVEYLPGQTIDDTWDYLMDFVREYMGNDFAMVIDQEKDCLCKEAYQRGIEESNADYI